MWGACHLRRWPGNFHCHNPSRRTTAQGSTKTLTEMSNRNISWRIKAAGAWGLQPYHLNVLMGTESFTLLQPSGPVETRIRIAPPLPLTRMLGILYVWTYNISTVRCLCPQPIASLLFYAPASWLYLHSAHFWSTYFSLKFWKFVAQCFLNCVPRSTGGPRDVNRWSVNKSSTPKFAGILLNLNLA
jgi:hypothetical protein